MDGISRDTVLGGRYTLQQALSSRAGVEQWIADDGTLGREVTVTVFAADHPHASAALDSARRVAGVEDRRLAQVLDVGTESDPAVSYVITEAIHHAQSVAALLRESRLPAEEVRRLVGESAVAMETARQRGLHHQSLDPHDVLRGPDGAVQVSGVAVAAALVGRDDEDGDEASRHDVRALVSIAYAGLTGRWPGDKEVPGVEQVERRADGQLPAPSELVDRVPGDLDTLCRTVLNAEDGPRTPGELARQLSPWSAERVHGAGGRAAGDARSTTERRRRLATGTAMTGASLASDDAIGLTDNDATDPGSLSMDEDPTMVGRRPEFDHDETSTYSAASVPGSDPYIEEDLEPPLPLLAHGTEEPDRESSRLALSIVAVVVVIAMLLGFLGLRSMFSGGDDEPKQAGQTTAGSSESGSSDPGQKSTPEPEPVKVTEVSTFGPDGGGEEHSWEGPNVIDDDPSTTWETRYYSDPEFSEGTGPGLVLNLGKPTPVSKVTVEVDGAPIDATVFTADEPAEGEELGTFSGDGEQSVTAKAPQEGQYVIVKVTKLGTQDNGQNRARISEVRVLS